MTPGARTVATVASLALGTLLGLALASRRTPRPRRIALIGDSLAVGLGPALEALAARDLVPFRYHGAVGTTPKQWATGAPACGACTRWLAGFAPTDTLVVLGTNDLGAEPDPSWYEGVREEVLRTGSACTWVQPPEMPAHSLAAVRATINATGCAVIPAARVPMGPDGVHPTPAGFQQWAWKIWGAVA